MSQYHHMNKISDCINIQPLLASVPELPVLNYLCEEMLHWLINIVVTAAVMIE